MPPKRGKKATAAVPAAPPLEDCKIAISGTFPGMTQAAVKAKAEGIGATILTAVTDATTHLIATDADYSKGSAKVAKAKELGIHIVSLDWLTQCEQNNTKEDEKDYLFGAAPKADDAKTDGAKSGQPDDASSTTAKSRKRATPAAGTSASDDETTAPKAKKARGKGSKTEAKAEESEDVKMEDVEDAEEAEPAPKKAAKAVGEGQVAKSKDIQIPLDEGCPYTTSTVHIDSDGVIYDASLNQTNATNNNNKFYRIQLLVDPNGTYRTWTRWGRVGEFGQTQTAAEGSVDDALKMFQKKFKDKSGLAWAQRGNNPKPGKYAFVERNYSEGSDDEGDDDDAKEKAADWEPPKSTLKPAVQDLMQLIFNQQFFANAMSSMNYDANKLPLGKLSKATITRGFQSLKDLAALLDDNTLAQSEYNLPYNKAVEQLSNTFYSLIPHDFGRNRPPVINSSQMVKKEIELLESLSDMKDAALIMKLDKMDGDIHRFDKQFQGLHMEEMEPLDSTSSEYINLSEYLMNTRGQTHGHTYEIESIFRIERQGEKDRFDNSPYGKLNQNRRLLWHGSRCTNFGGILSQGLRIAPPEAPVSGYMFDKGIYLADMASKSANYCCSYLSDNTALLLLCEAELGDPMQELLHSNSMAATHAKNKGMISTWGKGRNGPLKWKDASCVHPSLQGVSMPDTTVLPGDTNFPNASLWYNEYIAYDVSQVRLRYLFRIKM
ncbi:putative poly polymerase 2 [Cladorrhinum samala]|uniref:Poly [ADP-ribose] polymerase n=1 Tax=Cladorrhinum samala TaxID=585594 RepID=A0AAV9HU44_9PEZI|nr:putative poly polymerase 2 [Cladorrhinum samala]